MDDILKRLRRVEGQIRGLQKLVTDEADCDKFLTQLTAAKAALERIGMIVISGNMRKCVAEEIGGDKKLASNLDEAISVFLRHVDSLKS